MTRTAFSQVAVGNLKLLFAVSAALAFATLAGCNFLTINPATVSYNGNGSTSGVVPVDSVLYLPNMNVTVLGNTGNLAKSGYTFSGWNTDMTGTGTSRVPGSLFAMGSVNIILYATWIDDPITMLSIEGGTFTMGSLLDAGTSDEQPAHSVTLASFLLSESEVTQKQYQDVMGYNPSYFAAEPDNQTLPVEFVSWFDAVEFSNTLSIVQGFDPVYIMTDRVPSTGYPITSATVVDDLTKNGYRLPTEEEWEYAARGGDGSPGDYLYAGSNTLDEVAWHWAVSNYLSHQVKALLPNGLGLYDMTGNVWEWGNDWYRSYDPVVLNNPMIPANTSGMRVLRGGSYMDVPFDSRTAHRNGGTPGTRGANRGIRLARRP